MTPPIIPRDQVAEHLKVSPKILVRYEDLGLIQAVRDSGVEGYIPAEVRKVWAIVSYQRDLGVNLAGVEAILKLREHLAEVHHRLDDVTHELRELLEAESEHDG